MFKEKGKKTPLHASDSSWTSPRNIWLMSLSTQKIFPKKDFWQQKKVWPKLCKQEKIPSAKQLRMPKKKPTKKPCSGLLKKKRPPNSTKKLKRSAKRSKPSRKNGSDGNGWSRRLQWKRKPCRKNCRKKQLLRRKSSHYTLQAWQKKFVWRGLKWKRTVSRSRKKRRRKYRKHPRAIWKNVSNGLWACPAAQKSKKHPLLITPFHSRISLSMKMNQLCGNISKMRLLHSNDYGILFQQT